MNINLEHGIPFIKANFKHNNNEIVVSNVLIDTGAASSIISVDIALEIGLAPSPTDIIHRVRGVGGYEYVYEKVIESITATNIDISNFLVEVGDMDYGIITINYRYKNIPLLIEVTTQQSKGGCFMINNYNDITNFPSDGVGKLPYEKYSWQLWTCCLFSCA